MRVIIEKFNMAELNDIVTIWNEVIDEGESFYWREPLSTEIILGYLNRQDAVYCAKQEGKVIGFYIMHPNSPGRGCHIANALYAVTKSYRGIGLGKVLGEHSLEIAEKLAYKAIQFNGVISTNYASIRLWEGLGFVRVGHIKDAFLKDNNQTADVFIYHKLL